MPAVFPTVDGRAPTKPQGLGLLRKPRVRLGFQNAYQVGAHAHDRGGFRVWSPGFRVQGSGFRVQGAGFMVQDAGFRVQGAGCRAQGSGCRVQGAGCRVQSPESKGNLDKLLAHVVPPVREVPRVGSH